MKAIKAIEGISTQQNETSEGITRLLHENSRQMLNYNTTLSTFSDKMYINLPWGFEFVLMWLVRDSLQQTGIELRKFLLVIWMILTSGLQTLLRAYASTPREFEPCFTQKPVTFTDAHGRVHMIHVEWCNSWTVS